MKVLSLRERRAGEDFVEKWMPAFVSTLCYKSPWPILISATLSDGRTINMQLCPEQQAHDFACFCVALDTTVEDFNGVRDFAVEVQTAPDGFLEFKRYEGGVRW